MKHKIFFIIYLVLIFTFFIVSFSLVHAGGDVSDIDFKKINATFKIPSKKYMKGDSIKGELLITNTGDICFDCQLVNQVCFDGKCKRYLPFGIRLIKEHTIPINVAVEKPFKTFQLVITLGAFDIGYGEYVTKTFVHTIGKRKKTPKLYSTAELAFSKKYPPPIVIPDEQFGMIKDFCPLKEAIIQTTCKIPDTAKVFKSEGENCLFGVKHADNSSDTVVNLNLEKTHFLFAGKYIPYTNEELKEFARLGPSNKGATFEDVPSLGETAFVVKRPIDAEDALVGSKNYILGIWMKTKKMIPIIMSGGPDLERYGWATTNRFTSYGYGCDADELKDLMKNAVLPAINKL